MATNSSNFVHPISVISTYNRCDNCKSMLDKPHWSQCRVCKFFDLCDKCEPNEKRKYSELLLETREKHKELHTKMSKSKPANDDFMKPITDDFMKPILIEEVEQNEKEYSAGLRNDELDRIIKNNKIENDYDMSIVISTLTAISNPSSPKSETVDVPKLNSMVAQYYINSFKRNIRILCLDGGGVRGYMPIIVLSELITKKYIPDNVPPDHKDPKFKELFEKAQPKFINKFDYLAGTSTGGLIAFCLAINKSILELEEIYEDFSKYFEPTTSGWWSFGVVSAKYNPAPIHNKIDTIINETKLPDGTKLRAEDATLLDIRNILNPDNIISRDDAKRMAHNHGNLLEFVDHVPSMQGKDDIDKNTGICRANKEKVLLITAYNTTDNMMTVFNTSYAEHWRYRIADVLKATMAAPTYFPLHPIAMGKNYDGPFQPVNESKAYIDGGVFANDPELVALWAIRMQWKKPANYHLLSIGTCCYPSKLSETNWGGYYAWLFKRGNRGLLVNTLMDSTRSLTEIVTSNLAKFNDMRRMKFNYQLNESMEMDDKKFVTKFKDEWNDLKTKEDFKGLIWFYNKFIEK